MRRLIALIVVAGVALVGQGSWIYAKAWLAQKLLEKSWAATLEDGERNRPWPWADSWPVARLVFVDHGVDVIVLEGASGRNLAFAPGWLHGTARPGEIGATVIAGHRDTHFEVLSTLKVGDQVFVESAFGETREYRVVDMDTVDVQNMAAIEPWAGSELILVTCWPFDTLGGWGDQRYVVRCSQDIKDETLY